MVGNASILTREREGSLKDIGGAKSEYHELLRALEVVQDALRRLDRLQPSESTCSSLDSIKYVALSCQYPLNDFLAGIRRYDKTLGLWAKERPTSTALNKLKWTFRHQNRVSHLQTYLKIHVGTINILLAEYGLEKLDRVSNNCEASQLRLEQSIEATRSTVDGIKDKTTAQVQGAQNFNSVLTRLYQVILEQLSAPLKSLVNLVSQLHISSQQIYKVLLEMRYQLPLDTRCTFFQTPYLFEDALGRKYPIPSKFNFELMQTVIKGQFLRMPGYRQVLLGNYELFKTGNSQQIVSAATHLRPSTAITMAILLNMPITGSECYPMPECHSTQCEKGQVGAGLGQYARL
ncbi:hypothetical protein K469DRAFT_722762 [Zopfia rhizophila CBS 207.26]|uniref:Ubiquitin-like domain-containing protein n=1 Tax=Zopfia rhizophila CBS 207.26 TaxID=1314779 RepID=A0A6A6EX87_9PEZI|nr:hypothetical protein K469DRAFT_722762 [Zopfia rhizophila CBS 207.26]